MCAVFALGVGQNEVKECYAGNLRVARYGIFNGLERPRIIDAKHDLDDKGQLHLLGFDPPSSAPVAASLFDIGELNAVGSGFYTYKYIGLCSRHRRPVPVGDDTIDYTRSNPSPVSNAVFMDVGYRACSVTMGYLPREDISHIGLYRSLVSDTSNVALAGNWYLTVVTTNCSTPTGLMNVIDVVPDWELGDYAVETDNYPPNAYPYATEVDNVIFAGGSRCFGEGLTVTVCTGTWGVYLETAGRKFYDGIRGWKFTLVGDGAGGVDGLGHYYCRYLTDGILQLIDENGNPMNYDGDLSGTGRSFWAYIDGDVLRYSKIGEPESWPLTNSVNTRGEITGLNQIPNQSMLAVCTDRPEVRIFDLNVIGSPVFKNSLLVSNEFSAYQFSLCAVEGRLRGLDCWRGAIWECDGSAVRDITRGILGDIWKYLSTNTEKQKNWHSCYDPHQKIFATFVALASSVRYADFGIIQNVRTGRWFFTFDKDLLCTGAYKDPNTGREMVLGGTQGQGTYGGTWGRIFAKGHYNEWLYSDYKTHGTVVTSTATTVTVDVTDGVNLQTAGDGLSGRWVLVTDENDENEQLGFISANTTNQFTVNAVYGGYNDTQFDPVPEAGWKFYLGLIECKWGKKTFTFGDPAIMKQILDVKARITGTDEDLPPFIRVYRGTAGEYTRQASLQQREYIDASVTESWQSRNEPIEAAFQYGLTFYDRSYEGIELEDITITFQRVEE